MKMQQSYQTDFPVLYVIPTPIGNLEDVTLRTINVLNKVDMIYCEDKRVTAKLLNYLNINKQLKTYNEFSYEKVHNDMLDELESGQKIALVSDAGMPGISDPGYDIIKYLKDKDVNVVILPGTSAFVLPMVYTTNKSTEHLFKGFLSKHRKKYREELEQAMKNPFNTIIYESPHRILKTVTEISEIDPSRKLIIGRELTKIYEEYLEGTAAEVKDHFTKTKPRGEFILIIEPYEEKQEAAINYINKVDEYISKGMTTKMAVKEVSENYNLSKNKVYNEYLNSKK